MLMFTNSRPTSASAGEFPSCPSVSTSTCSSWTWGMTRAAWSATLTGSNGSSLCLSSLPHPSASWPCWWSCATSRPLPSGGEVLFWIIRIWQKAYLFWYCSLLPLFFKMPILTSVTRFGDLLDFGQVFKAFGNN